MTKRYDLIVLGGGITGVAAAVSAARQGLSVLLVEKTGCLGGAMSASLVYPFMRHATKGENPTVLSRGIFEEMKNRHASYGDTSWETYKILFDDMLTESGAEVLFHTCVFRAETQGRRVTKLFASSGAGILELEAEFFLDTSGDGELIAMTGCACQLGREEDCLCQPMTTCFRLSGVDIALFKEERPALQEIYKQQQAEGRIQNPRENILVFFNLADGILHLNTTRVVRHDPTDPFALSRAEILARKQVLEMFAFLKANARSCKDASIVTIAAHIGVRESRKLKGEYILTAEDLLNSVDFEDTIALGCYSIDIHNPEGTGTYIRWLPDGEFYRIPYRSLLPREYDNLLAAGRCLSATHEAHSAVRIMPICACMGEAAATALAVAKQTQTNTHTVDIKTVQQRLIAAGNVIL